LGEKGYFGPAAPANPGWEVRNVQKGEYSRDLSKLQDADRAEKT